jgi:2-keto-3-deoxygluconate permease
VLLLARVVSGLLVALVYRLLAKDGFIMGVSVLAAVAAVSNTNGSIFIATTALLKDEEAAASAPVLALSNGPFLTALILGMSGAAFFSWLSLLALVIPMLLGILLGNLNAKIAAFFEPGIALTLPLIGFTLGAGIDLRQIWQSGLSGLLLAVVALLVGGVVAVVLDRITRHGNGAAGIAACATGANAIAVPAAIALSSPAWQPFANTATAQISTAVIVSAIVVPLLAEWMAKRKCPSSRRPL